MAGFIRQKVSKNKRRYKKDGFDLDLTYILGKRVIAMGFPSESTEALYRNPLLEVQRFFETYHGDNYYLYNLCQEKDYDHSKFHDRVKNYPFYDHNAPPLKMISDCCLDIHEWLNGDPKHMVGINCKAGKGRTGLIICCYLMHCNKCKTTDEALRFYGRKRTKDGKGVTIASQQRYIRYYERILKELSGEIPVPPVLTLTRIRVDYFPRRQYPNAEPSITIEINDDITFRSPSGTVEKIQLEQYKADIPVMGTVEGDVKIQLHSSKKQSLCHFWFNTAFVDDNRLTLTKPEIDVANKDKKSKVFKDGFSITAYFKEYDPDDTHEKKKSKPKKKNKDKITTPTKTKKKIEPEEEPEIEIVKKRKKNNENNIEDNGEVNGEVNGEENGEEKKGVVFAEEPENVEERGVVNEENDVNDLSNDEAPPPPQRNNRKSFFNYSDYGALQEQLSLSEEETDFSDSMKSNDD